jgi:SulP family sulfate permease
MAEMTGIEGGTSFAIAGRADDGNGERVPYDPELAVDRDVLVYRITGAFFFGAAAAIGSVLDGIADKRKAFVVDFAAVPFLDSTAANAMGRVAAKARRQGIQLFITGASPTVRRALLTHGVSPPRARYRETIARAVADINNKAAGGRRGLERSRRELAHDSEKCSEKITQKQVIAVLEMHSHKHLMTLRTDRTQSRL